MQGYCSKRHSIMSATCNCFALYVARYSTLYLKFKNLVFFFFLLLLRFGLFSLLFIFLFKNYFDALTCPWNISKCLAYKSWYCLILMTLQTSGEKWEANVHREIDGQCVIMWINPYYHIIFSILKKKKKTSERGKNKEHFLYEIMLW